MMLSKPSMALSPAKLASGLIAALLLSAAALRANETVEKIEADTDRWIEIQSQIAKEKNQWKTDKELLQGSIKVLTTRNEALKQNLESNQTASGLFTSNYQKVANAIQENEAAIEFLESKLPALEAKLRAIAPRLPLPLRDEVEGQLQKISSGDASMTATASTRVQSLVATLTAIDRFNNSLTLSHEIRSNGQGGEVDVSILYWGLSSGYAVAGNGEQAWILTPGPESWVWTESDLGIEIKMLIERYESRENPVLVSLPTAIK